MLNALVRRLNPARTSGAAGRGGALLDRAAMRLFAHYYRDRRWHLALYALLASAQSLLVLPILYLIRQAFDRAIPQSDTDALIAIGAGIVLVRLLHSLSALGLRAYILRPVKRAVAALRRDLLDRLYALERDYFSHADLDRMHARIVQDSERFDNLSVRLLSAMLPALFASTALLLVLVALNWRLVAWTAAILPVLVLASRLAGRRVKRDVYVFQRAFEQFSKGVLFALRQMDLTRLKASEGWELARQHGYVADLGATGQRMAMSFARHGQLQRNLTGLAGIVILVAGGIAVAEGTMSLGDLLAFYVAAGLLNGQLDNLISGIPELIAGNESLLTLHALLHEGRTEPYQGRRRIDFDGRLSLRHVTFAYGEHVVLRGLDLELAPGANVAIVGPNGAGKSTLLGLLVGFARPQQGGVFAASVAYEELDLRALRRQIGVVMQHPGFFTGTVLENIRYGCPDASLEEVRAAARLALADDFVRRLPEGYDTEIGTGGALLSGGERQRLAIARALLGRPKLLILDEPTNHLDAEAIARLMDGLMALPDRPGLLVISHDPGVIAYADTVYRLEQGRLVPIAAGPASRPRPPFGESSLGSCS